MGCMLSLLLYGIQVPFLLTGKGVWLSLSEKIKGTVRTVRTMAGKTLLSVPGKVLAHLLLMRIWSHLLKYQRPEQSWFTPVRSTTDCILALHILVERRREF